MADNYQSPEIVVRELRRGVPQIRGVPTSVAAFVGRTLRGPNSRAVRCDSLAKAMRIFGTYDPNSYVMEQVAGFFLNGGSAAYLVRPVATGGTGTNTKATKVINTAAAAPTLTATAVGFGEDYNSLKVQVTKEDTKLAIAGGALVAAAVAGATASLAVPAAARALVRVGDTLKWADGTNTLRAIISRIDDNTLVFEASQTLGVGGLTLALCTLTLETWSLTVLERGKIIQGPITGLRMSPLSKDNYFVTRINVLDDDEAVITVTDSAASTAAGLDTRPVNTATGGDLLATGSTMSTYADADYIGSSAGPTGLYCLDKKRDVRLVSIPGVTGTTTGAVTKGLIDYCTSREDCVALVAAPANTTPTGTVTFKDTNLGGTSYGIMYAPWLQILGPLTGQKAVTPPDGYVMGMIARTDRTRGVAKAPAGELDGQLRGVIGVERELTKDEKDLLYPANINPIEMLDGNVAAMGSRTMESGEFNQINVRRTFIYMKVSIKDGTRFVLFEPNDVTTRAKVRRVIAAFLGNEWRKGNLDGKTLDKAFWVVCDESNNPPTVINAQKFVMDCGLNIPKTIEFATFNLQQDQRALEAQLGF